MYFNENVENYSARDSVSTTQTRFFHGVGHLQFIEHNLFPEWASQAASATRARHIRIWSMGAAGYEPYSLAFTLLERFPVQSGWRIQILTTHLLAPVRGDICPLERSKAMARLGSDVGPIVEYHRVNLKDDVAPLGGPFDLMWCGNVLTYFNYKSKASVRGRAAQDVLSPKRDRSKTPTQ
jgi:chemotaxis protein methyltransferase CheR